MEYNGITADGLKAITSALELSAYERKKVKQHQKLSQLADEDVVYMIRKNVHYLWLDYHFDDAQKWLSIKSQKYDKRKKYSEKDSYDYLVGYLKEIFQVDVLEIIEMCYEGYGQYTRWITFVTDSDYVFHMTVPVVKMITVDLLPQVNYGKIALGYYTSEHCMHMCGTSYNMSDLKATMDEILTIEKHLPKAEV